VLVAHACNPSYLGGGDQEDCGSRPAWGNSFRYSISKITKARWNGGVAKAAEHLLCKHEALSSNFCPKRKTLKLIYFLLQIPFHVNMVTFPSISKILIKRI
jgi:hypothetical protein